MEISKDLLKGLIRKAIKEEKENWPLDTEGKLTERTYVSNVKKVGKLEKWTIVKGGKKVDVLGSKKFFDDGKGFSKNDPDDALELWNLGKKFKGKQVPDVYGEGKLTEKVTGQYKVSPKVQMHWGMDKVVIISGNKRVVLNRKEMKSLMKGVKANKLTEGEGL